MSLYDTYKSVAASMEVDKLKLFRQLDEHIDGDLLITARFCLAFYRNTGMPGKYLLVAFLKSLVLQKIFGYVHDSVLLVTLRHSREMRKFCGFQKVPDVAKFTRYKQDFLPYITEVFERLVELTEPVCQEMDAEFDGRLIYDTTGIESYVAENNPKFFSPKLRQAKLMAKTKPDTDPYRAAYVLLPDCAAANPMDADDISGRLRRKKRFIRLKFVCPKTVVVRTVSGASLRCTCETPCSASEYGRCVYIYPDVDLRLYPGVLRGSPDWDELYARRTAIERSIGSFKYVLGVGQRKTSNSQTTKADLFLAGIVQLLCVALADALCQRRLFRRIRSLAA